MDNENLLAKPDETAATQPDIVAEPSPQKTRDAVVWRFVLLAVALILIFILLYPLLKSPSPLSSEPSSEQVETSPTLTAPEATVQANPESAPAQFELGNTYVRTGEWAKAVQAYRKAIELDPNYQTAYANLGVVYYQQGQFDLAASQYEKALELDPNDGEVAYNLGALYLQQALATGGAPDLDRLNQAIAQLEYVQALDPDLAEPYFGLGVAYTVLERRADAIQAFETFLARDTGQDPRASQEAQRYLQDLREQ